MFELLFALGFVLVIITLVGHGIWVLVARLLSGGEAWDEIRFSSARRALPERCPVCDTSLGDRLSTCGVCGWPTYPEGFAEPGLGLKLVRQKIEQLARVKLLDRYEADRLIEFVRNEQLPPTSITHAAAAAAAVIQLAPSESPDALPIVPAQPIDFEPPPAAIDIALSTATVSSAIQPGLAEPATSGDVLTRAMAYNRHRQAEIAEPGAPRSSGQRQQALSEILLHFMEEKNIRWGELIGGLLIVCCSVALVISFWSQIAEQPFLKFFLFNGVTAGLFGIGLRADSHWKLRTTSHGLLTIGTLLVPLNFLAIAALARGATTSPLVLLGEAASILLFSILVYLAGKILVGQSAGSLVLGVVGPAAAELLVRRFVVPEVGLAWIAGIALLPLACYLISCGLALRCRTKLPTWDEHRAVELFALLGTSTFAMLLVSGLLLVKSGAPWATLCRLAPLTSAAGLPAMAIGLALMRRLSAPDLAAWRTAATSVAVFGTCVLLSGLPLGWKEPIDLALVGAVDCSALIWTAIAFQIPAANLVAVAAIVPAWLAVFHAGMGNIAWRGVNAEQMVEALASAASGSVLLPLVVVCGCVSWALSRQRLARHAPAWQWAAVGVASLSIGLALAYGFGHEHDSGTTWVLGFYSLALLAVGARSRPAAVCFGALLLFLALVQAIAYRYAAFIGDTYPVVVGLLVSATALSVAAAALVRGNYPIPAARWAWLGAPLALSAASIVPVAALVPDAPASAAGYCFWLSGVWLLLAWLDNWAQVFASSQIALACGVALAAGELSGASWWLAPRHLAAQGLALALLSGLWIALRLALWRAFVALERSSLPVAMSQLLRSPKYSVDRATTAGLVAALLIIAVLAAWPGVAHEMASRAAVAHAHDGPAWLDQAWARAVPNPTMWAFLLALLGVLVAAQWELPNRAVAILTILVLWSVCPLTAASYPGAGASTLRWCAACYALLISVAIWSRSFLANLARRVGGSRFDAHSPIANRGALASFDITTCATAVVWILGLLPVLALTIAPALAAIGGDPCVGPQSGTVFARVGDQVSFLVPLAFVGATLLGHAVRLRSEFYAFAAGLTLNLTVSLAFVLPVVNRGGSLGHVEMARLLAQNAVASGVYALAWLAAAAIDRRASAEPRTARQVSWLQLQCCLGTAFVAALVVPDLVRLIASPAAASMLYLDAGLWSWIGTLVAAAALRGFDGRENWLRATRSRFVWLAITGVLAASLAALTACRWDQGDWLAYHTLLAGYLGATCMLTAADVRQRSQQQAPVAIGWIAALSGVVLALALRACLSDPARPWWSVGALAALVPVAVTLTWTTRKAHYLAVAAALVNLSATIWWIERPLWQPPPGFFWWHVGALLECNAIALALPAGLWLAIEHRLAIRCRLHSQAAAAATAIVALVIPTAIGGRLIGAVVPAPWLLHTISLSAAALGALACLWDARVRWSIAGLYSLGFLGLATLTDAFSLTPRWFAWTMIMLAGAYTLATSYLWSRRRGLLALADRLRMPRDEQPPFSGLSWLVPANWLVSSCVVLGAFSVVLMFPERSLRLLAANAALIQTVAVGILARGKRRSELRDASLGIAVLGAIAWGWAWRGPALPMLERSVIVAVALAAASIAYGAGAKFFPTNVWAHSARRLLPALLALTGASLCVVLGVELNEYVRTGHVIIGAGAIAAVIVGLVGLGAAAVAAALIPGRDPLRLSERGRTAYVYAAEGLAALSLLHARLTMPWLFAGFFLRYWPLGVIVLAFAGVGLAEMFRRQGREVLSQPLERTGVLLPLLPVLGYWVGPAASIHYSLQLLAVGMLYAILSVMRRSFGFGLLAAMAANGGLWFFLSQEDQYGLLVHPQLWLVPAALSVLAAAYLNRDSLNDDQMTAIRYMTSLAVYLSSTADIFINGVADAPWLPLVLAGLSIAGVALGIMLEVRAFLFLGTGFLVLSLMTIIWHAAVDLDQTWLWAASGIVAGILIIALFAAFEKRREDVLVLVERLRQWEP